MSVEKEALECRLTASDRRRIFQSLGFQINGEKPNKKGWIAGILGPPELGEGKSGSFSVNVETGAVHDFGSSGYKGDLYKAVMDVHGCTFPEALAWIAKQIGYRSNGHAKRAESPLSLERLAEAKGLPPPFLRKLGVEQIQPGKLRITYRDRGGNAAAVRQRLRTATSAKDGSLWEKGSKPIVPYGLWLLDRMLARHSYGLILEGETDSWTAWKYGIPALGIPGKSMHGMLELEHVEDFERLYVCVEADEAGQEFARNMHGRLQEIGYEGSVYALSFPEDAPDLNDLYRDDPGSFEERLGRMMEKTQAMEGWLKENTGAAGEPSVTEAEAKEAEAETQPPDYAPFPLKTLPAPAADYVRASAKALPCAEAMIAVPMLSVLASAVGAAAEIQIKSSWQEPSLLWTALCQPSGSIKSSAVEKAVYPIHQLTRQAGEEYEYRQQEYKEAKARGEDIQEPKRRRYRVDDITVESVCDVLSDNPRGVLAYRDELAGWLGMMDRYAKNEADLQSWIAMYEVRPVAVDRKTTKSAMLPRPAVSVCGTIQPGTLKKRVTDLHIESGFLARLQIVSPPARPKRFTEHDVTPECKQAYAELVEKLFEIPIGTTLDLTREAKELFAAFVDSNGEEVYPMDEGPARSVAAKTDGLVARLALVLHLARRCSGETSGTDVDAESMARALTLAKWLRNETLRTYETLGLAEAALPPKQRFLRKLPEEFETKDARALAKKEGIPRSTMFDWLKKLTKAGDLEKVRHGLYRNPSSAGLWTNRTNLHKDDAGSRENVKESPKSPKSNEGNASEPRHPISTNGLASTHSGRSEMLAASVLEAPTVRWARPPLTDDWLAEF